MASLQILPIKTSDIFQSEWITMTHRKKGTQAKIEKAKALHYSKKSDCVRVNALTHAVFNLP